MYGVKRKKLTPFEKVPGPCFILGLHAACLEQGDLLVNIDGGFVDGSHATNPAGIKNPLNLCLTAEAAIGMAGVLRASLCTEGGFCKKAIAGFKLLASTRRPASRPELADELTLTSPKLQDPILAKGRTWLYARLNNMR